MKSRHHPSSPFGGVSLWLLVLAFTCSPSGDLISWNHNGDATALTYTSIVSSVNHADGITSYVVHSQPLIGGDPRLFARLRWTKY